MVENMKVNFVMMNFDGKGIYCFATSKKYVTQFKYVKSIGE